MYPFVLFLHSANRWLVLGSAIVLCYFAWEGKSSGGAYQRINHVLLSIYVGSFHLQAFLGVWLYFWLSPVTELFFQKPALVFEHYNIFFFSLYHITLMLLAISITTIGSGKIKRATDDKQKFKLTLLYILTAFALVLAAIPYDRPAFRSF